MFSQDKYLKALTFASTAHGEQKTPMGLPYLTHLCSVAMEVMHACEESSYEVEKADFSITCALLHDVLEDTSCTYDDVFDEFGLEVADGVESLTKDKTLSSKQEQMSDSINRILTQSYELQMVKLADRITNLQTPPNHWDNAKKKAYLQEAKFIYSCLKNSNLYLSTRLKEKIDSYNTFIETVEA